MPFIPLLELVIYVNLLLISAFYTKGNCDTIKADIIIFLTMRFDSLSPHLVQQFSE